MGHQGVPESLHRGVTADVRNWKGALGLSESRVRHRKVENHEIVKTTKRIQKDK